MEKRKHQRVVMKITIKAKKIIPNSKSPQETSDIDVFDISTGGIGFTSYIYYPVGEFFDAEIVLLNGDRFSCVLKLVRSSMSNDIFTYGAEFISLSDTDRFRIQTYAMLLDN